MTITVHTVHQTGGSVATCFGTDESGRNRVFYADWRPASHIAEAIEEEGEVDCEVEEWQFIC